MKSAIYYHFTGDTLRDRKPIPAVGEWLIFYGDPIPCTCGLHASPDPFDALKYAPGAMLHQVELAGKIIPHGDPVNKFAAQKRQIIATIDATEILRFFARRVALDVIHTWKAPQIVREYLETGDESKMTAARDAARAAWAAARAVWDAAGAAAWAAGAAGDAAEVAGAAAWAAWAAGAAKQKLYRGWFNEMVEAQFALQNRTA